MSLLLAQRNWAKSEAEYMHERLGGKSFLDYLLVSCLSPLLACGLES